MVNECATIFQKDRFDLKGCQRTMKAVVTNGNGGYEQLEYRDVRSRHSPRGEVLLQVLAAGFNDPEINTRLGWYSCAVTTGTQTLSAGETEKAKAKADGGWNKTTPFPFIRARIAAGGLSRFPGCSESALGLRVLVRPCIRRRGGSPWRISGWPRISTALRPTRESESRGGFPGGLRFERCRTGHDPLCLWHG